MLVRILRVAIVGAVVLLAGMPTAGVAAEKSGAARALLLEKHSAAGLACNACHRETPPAKPAGMATCLSCHGTYDSLADKTDGKGAHNPHTSHDGDLSCDSCHHVHRPSVNYCAKCHQFHFDVP